MCSEFHMVLPVRQNILLSAHIIIVVTWVAQNLESLLSSYLIRCSSNCMFTMIYSDCKKKPLESAIL
jgi:hypothetical protein